MDEAVGKDIDHLRSWRDEWADSQLRHCAMPAGEADLWEAVDAAIREMDRRIDPDDLDDEQTAIYEAGYVRGQAMMAEELRRFARRFDADITQQLRDASQLIVRYTPVGQHPVGEQE